MDLLASSTIVYICRNKELLSLRSLQISDKNTLRGLLYYSLVPRESRAVLFEMPNITYEPS